MRYPDWVVTGPPSTVQTWNSYRGNSGPRSVPKTSHTTPSSNAAMFSTAITATFVNMTLVWQIIAEVWQSCHCPFTGG